MQVKNQVNGNGRGCPRIEEWAFIQNFHCLIPVLIFFTHRIKVSSLPKVKLWKCEECQHLGIPAGK
jgi:hypothetical protein